MLLWLRKYWSKIERVSGLGCRGLEREAMNSMVSKISDTEERERVPVDDSHSPEASSSFLLGAIVYLTQQLTTGKDKTMCFPQIAYPLSISLLIAVERATVEPSRLILRFSVQSCMQQGMAKHEHTQSSVEAWKVLPTNARIHVHTLDVYGRKMQQIHEYFRFALAMQLVATSHVAECRTA